MVGESKHGHLVRLWGIQHSQLPPPDAKAADLKPFVTSILLEALPLLNDLPAASASSPWRARGSKKLAHSTAPVQLYERTVSAEELQAVARKLELGHGQGAAAETWFLRRSVHEDAAAAGTASWDEFEHAFKDEHAETEMAFTPTVVSTQLRRQWDCAGLEADAAGSTWERMTLKLEESVHKLPAPLKKRLFPVLQLTAAARGRHEFVVVQIAARDPAAEARGGGDTVRGAYTSVERLRAADAGGIEWVMGTASDARGNLPAWMQKMAVPGQVAKDVDMFLEWIADERKSRAKAKPTSSPRESRQPPSQPADGAA